MRNFLKQHGLWVLFAAAVISVALCLLAFFSASASQIGRASCRERV